MKNLKALVFLFLANFVSGFAQGITMLSIPWYLVSHYDDGKWLNSALMAGITLGSLFWGIFAGSLVDRYNRKRIFQTFNGVDGIIMIGLGTMGAYFGEMPFFLIAIAAVTTIFTFNLHYPNLYAFVQELFERKFYTKVNSAVELQGQLTNALGMFTGGILLVGSSALPQWWPAAFDAWKLNEVFLLDGCTYLLSFCFISLIPYNASLRTIDKGSTFARIRQGFQYLWSHKPLLIFGINSHLVFFAVIVTVQALTAIYVNDYLQAPANVMANFSSTYATGAIIAGLLGLTALGSPKGTIKKIIFLIWMASTLFLTLALTQSVVITLTAALFLGIANAGTRILRITYIIRTVPNRVVGRVNSFLMVVNVFMRFSFLAMLTLPFFAHEENGGNVVYALGLISIVLFMGGLILVLRLKAYEK